MPITDEEFRLFRDLVYSESGICLKENRKDFLENRLAKRMAETQIDTPYWYYRFVSQKRAELLILLDLLTVNETFFFRNRPQLDLFRNVAIPELMRRKIQSCSRTLRIWSAGCSTGEEPYSLAMILFDVLDNPRTWDVKIYASDLSLSALEAASRGEYTPERVNASVEAHLIPRYFDSFKTDPASRASWDVHGFTYRVREDLRRWVIFDFHNLKNENGLSGLDVVFCRNVMIYFDFEAQKRLVEKMHRSLNPGGYLFIGHAETLHGMNPGFQFIFDNRGTAYRKNGGAEAEHPRRNSEEGPG